MSYHPDPIDTSSIELQDELVALRERLAENTHNVWARQRVADGWIYGAERDDEQKRHPCLVPYGELPESEKEYDRQVADEVLKAIVALGFRIEK